MWRMYAEEEDMEVSRGAVDFIRAGDWRRGLLRSDMV